MASKNEQKSAKKRVGRKRQPPLAPGPALQFVVASHPDDFRAENTMRHVRSHVMYKHRGDTRGGSPVERSKSGERTHGSITMTRTPSPMTTSSDGALEESNFLTPGTRGRNSIWDSAFYQDMSQSATVDPSRHLAARIIAATTAKPPRSAPPAFEEETEYPFPSAGDVLGSESLDDLRDQWITMTGCLVAQDLAACDWMRWLCSNCMSFLGVVSVACVFQDVNEGYSDDTALTVYAKTKLMRMITDSLNTQTDDFTLCSILHLLISEIGGQNEDVFDVHQEALIRIVDQRGGIDNLGMDGSIAAFLSVVILCFTILRGRSEPPVLRGFIPIQTSRSAAAPTLPFSPLYAPNGDLYSLYGRCSSGTYEIINDMYDLTHTFITRWSYPSSDAGLVDARMEQIYTRLLYRPSTEDSVAPDWIYESCRITALIYCRSIVQGMPLAHSANIMHARSSGANTATTVISALHHAVEQTDKERFWGDLGGVFMWVCLVGGAASWSSSQFAFEDLQDTHAPPTAWIRKSFALNAIRSSISDNFYNATANVEAQRTMLEVQHLIGLRRAIS